MTISYSLVGDSRGQTLTVIYEDGEATTVPSSHANFTSVLGYLVDTPLDDVDEDHVRNQLNVLLAVGTALTPLSERVMVSGNAIYFDGEELNTTLGDHIVRILREGDENGWKPFVNFLEKLATNPSLESRDALFTWINGRGITITEDGDFVAYKGVKIGDNGESLSIHAGPGFVDNVAVNGYIPNNAGTVISVSRSYVDANTGVGCSTGLHAGTWKYASDFAQGRVLEVHINPRDVVSVPSDCSYQKLRVSRYLVVNEIEQEYTAPTVYAFDDEDNDWAEDSDFYADDSDEYWGDDPEDDEDEENADSDPYGYWGDPGGWADSDDDEDGEDDEPPTASNSTFSGR